jgi:hypothetical protein
MKPTRPGLAEPSPEPSPPPRSRSASPPSPAKRQRLVPGELQVLKRAGASSPGTNRPRAPQHPAALSPSPDARFGLEIEIPSVDVSTPAGGAVLRRGAVLLERSHWKLECDDLGGGRHDLEFVTNPLAGEDEVRAAIGEITTLAAALRARALAGDMTVRLKDVVDDANIDAVLRLDDPHLPGRLQATYGVGLAHLGMLIDELLPARQAETIHGNTQKVADLYAARTGAPLPAGARAFIRLINLYLARAQATLPADGTVHVFFRAMARSDFCAAYARLLAPGEQEAVRTLLTAADGMPPLMEALELRDPAQRVFARPYLRADRNPHDRQAGPTIKDWLASIVEGRGEGPLHKDLLSPPPGYPLHSGDLSTDYGMGAMGVDERNGLMLFEIRGAPYRPQHVTMNGQLARAAAAELARAARHNPALKTALRAPRASAKYDALRAADEAYVGMRNAVTTMTARAAPLDARGRKFMERHLEFQLARLDKARVPIAARTGSSWSPGLSLAMDRLQQTTRDVLRTGRDGDPQDLPAKIELLKGALAQCEDVLWHAGARRK